MNFSPSRGFLVAPYSAESERMAYALVRSLRRVNSDIPVQILGLDYICGLNWRGLAQVRSVRAAEAHGSPYQWFNKLAALIKAPFEETIYLDCDVVFLKDPSNWFNLLDTDDLTWFTHPHSTKDVPDIMIYNRVNPYRVKEEFGIDTVPSIDGGGHFFFRNNERGRFLVECVVNLMQDSMTSPNESLYRKMMGAGNIEASDEASAAIVAIQQKIKLPEVFLAPDKQMGLFLPPHQCDEHFQLDQGLARYRNAWTKEIVTPLAIHFCHDGKRHPAYAKFISDCVEGIFL